MFFPKAFALFLASAAVANALAMPQFGDFDNNDNGFDNGFDNNGFDNNDGGDTSGGDTSDGDLALDPNLVQDASAATGQEDGTEGVEDGQAESLTDTANFINFCEGKTLTNGLQAEGGSCNGIPMGDLPSTSNMISAIFVNPSFGQTIPANQAFTIQVQYTNLAAGTFTNPDVTYYSAPQQLDGNGNVIGHSHVTVQNIGQLNPTTPPDAQDFDFFLGINDDGNGQGLLAADVTDGLDAGTYRVCTITSAANHQTVNMPVAQRGAQEDCVRFTVSDNGGGNGGFNSTAAFLFRNRM